MEQEGTEQSLNLTEDEVILLESLVHSPAFRALKKVLDSYRKEILSRLLTAVYEREIFQAQGRMIGINAIENLPAFLVNQRNARLRKAEETQKAPSPFRATRA